MTSPVNNFQDILNAMEREPALRDALRRHILTEELLQVPVRLERMEGDISTPKEDVGTLKEDVSTFKQDVSRMGEDISWILRDRLRIPRRRVRSQIPPPEVGHQRQRVLHSARQVGPHRAPRRSRSAGNHRGPRDGRIGQSRPGPHHRWPYGLPPGRGLNHHPAGRHRPGCRTGRTAGQGNRTNRHSVRHRREGGAGPPKRTRPGAPHPGAPGALNPGHSRRNGNPEPISPQRTQRTRSFLGKTYPNQKNSVLSALSVVRITGGSNGSINVGWDYG